MSAAARPSGRTFTPPGVAFVDEQRRSRRGAGRPKWLGRVLGCLALTIGLTAGAVAFFTGAGIGTASAGVTTLTVPAGPTASSTGTSASITWSASTIGGSAAATSYAVERYSAGGTDLGAASCSPVASTSGVPNAFGSFSCTDTPSGGTYKYKVSARYHSSWTATTAFTNQVTVQNLTVTTAAGPASGTAGTAIATASISATLSGAGAGASGTITYTVFGPQATAPATCTSGGTTVGTATVTANGTYHPSAGYTPTTVGTYWWYASYSGDANNTASTSTCSGSMSSTVVSKASPTLTAAGPASGFTSTAIAASAISSVLAGGSAPTGTITYKVFGPQASAPSTCTSGGTTVGTAAVSGNGTYNPSAGYTPSTPGTYWWYASYGGDANDNGATSTCGAGMASTAVKNFTATTAGGPASGTAGNAIATSTLSSTLAGASGGATGTITYTVFGPQASAPTTCTSGGTTVGTATVAGNGTYNPSAAFTPPSAGTYWWYASYSGDANNAPSTSTCGGAMAFSYVYSLTSVASVVDQTNTGTSGTTSSFTVQPSTTYLLLIFRRSASTGDAITSITSSGLNPSLSAAFTPITSQAYGLGVNQWAYYVTTASNASGTGTITVNFVNTVGGSGSTIIDLLALGGANTANPIVIGNEGLATATSSSATASLPNAPSSADMSVVFLGDKAGMGASAPAASPAMFNQFYAQPDTHSSTGVYIVAPPSQNESFSIGNSIWGTIALEIRRPGATNATGTTAAAPSTGTVGTAIAASSVSSVLSGATSGATGTITYTVFGPQASAPSTCTSGGTTVGTATVAGNGTYNPSAAYTPPSAGTYWWYASYGGDADDDPSSSTCGAGMASTVVAKANPTATAAAPSTGIAGTAVAASSLSSVLSGATSGATGTITYTVFGPQASAPSTCTSGGTTVGTATVAGNGTYNPSAAFTPSSAGTYWWYASYSGDANNAASTSTCGGTMAATYVYTMSSVASVTDTTPGTSTSTSNFTVLPSTTYLLLIFRHSVSGDGLVSIASTSLSPALSTGSFTSITSQPYNTIDYQWAYYVTTAANASGTGKLTVTFTSNSNQATTLDLVALGGNSTSSPIITSNEGAASGNSTTATANLPSAPSSSDAGLVFLSAQGALGATVPVASPAMTNVFYSQQTSGTSGTYWITPAPLNASFSIASSPWGTIALEIRHG